MSTEEYTPNECELATQNIYENAIRVGSPHLVLGPEDDEPLPIVSKKVVRQVEVPFTRQVKVPVKTRQIVPEKRKQMVRTRQLVEVDDFEDVDEEYTSFEERTGMREKEVWVRKIVSEPYTERVPVTRTRRVRKPTKRVQEVFVDQEVEVQGSRVVEVDGFRIDDVQDSRLVEVEEIQNYELRPVATGVPVASATRDLGRVAGQHNMRRVGQTTLTAEAARDFDEDSVPDMGRLSMRDSTTRRRMLSTQQQSTGGAGKIGMVVRNANTNGVFVTKVYSGGPADRAGIQVNDLITFAGQKPTTNLSAFRAIIAAVNGPILLQLRKSNGARVTTTLVR